VITSSFEDAADDANASSEPVRTVIIRANNKVYTLTPMDALRGRVLTRPFARMSPMIFRKPSTMFGLPIRRFLLSVVSLKCSIGASLAMRWTQPSETPARRLQEIIWV